ncbi:MULTISPECIES: hypothetical protein [unclassified Afipia]|uniref:hypothetical protein n=1 Tax=unclassified Afipia TaxID=2642050 RepID=UPI0004677B78|nr:MULTISPECIES: hypothetical protein [unclassified Afipia]
MAIPPLNLPGYAAPQAMDFTSLANLGQVVETNRRRSDLASLGRGLSDGTIDYRAAAGKSADMGDIDTSLRFLALAEAKDKLGREQEASSNFATQIGGMFGQPGAAQPGTPRPASNIPPTDGVRPSDQPNPAQPQARAPVQSSPTTWGDREAEDAGLYPTGGTASAEPKPLSLASLGDVVPPPQRAAPVEQPPARPAATPAAQSAASGINISHVPQLLQAVSNPNLPAGQKEIAKTLLTRALDDAKTPERISFLQKLKQESNYQGTILDLERELRAAGKTDVKIDQRAESEEEKAAGQGAGKRRSEMFAAAGAAGKTLTNLSRMESLLGQVSQGKIEPGRMTVSAWAKSLGLNDEVATSLGLDPKGVGSAQALQSLVNESVIGKIGSGGFPANNFSDADRAFITQIFPTLGDDPRANRIRVETGRRMAQLDIQRAKDYQAWKSDPQNKGKGFENFEVFHADKTSKQDLFGDLRRDAEKLTGPARPEAGNTYDNPNPAKRAAPASQRQQAPNGIGWSIVE